MLLLLGITAYYFYGLGQNRSDVEKTKQSLWINGETSPVQKSDTVSHKKENDTQSTPLYATGGLDTPLSKDFFASLPVGASFWNPVNLWGGTFTYSDLKWLEISRIHLTSSWAVTCETITDFLSSSLSWYYWWNTCRPIWKTSKDTLGTGVSFFVLKLNNEGTEYIYEKHYLLPEKWWYGVYELKIWILADKANIDADIRTQSNALKSMNFDMLPLDIVEELFLKLSL